MKKNTVVLALTIGAIAATGPSLTALDLKNVLTDYTVTTWSRWDVFSSGAVWAIVQDRVGYLWLGTDAGLVRFDGVRFVQWDAIGNEPLRKAPVRAMTVSRDSSLWVGFDRPGGISRIRNGSVREFGEADGLSTAAVSVLIEDRHGSLLAGTADGLYELTGDQWQKIATHHRIPIRSVRCAYISRAGTLFLGTDEGAFQQSDDRKSFQRVGAYNGPVLGIGEDASGRLLITDETRGFRTIGIGNGSDNGIEQGRGNLILRDHRGYVWVATRGQGLWRLSASDQADSTIVEKTNVLTGLAADWVNALMEDREGNIWAGAPGGLSRLAPRLVTPVMNLGPVAAMEATSDGSVWVEAVDTVIRFSSGDSKRLLQKRLSLGSQITALSADEEQLWVATTRELVRIVKGQRVPVPNRSATPPFERIDLLSPDRRGGIWLYDRTHGLMQVTGNQFASYPLDTTANGTVVSMFTDRVRRLWLAFSEGHVAVVDDDGTFQRYGEHDGLARDVYTVIYEDNDGVVWLGGERGISRFTAGRFASLAARTGFPVDKVLSVVQDDQGDLWIGTSFGIVRVQPAELETALSDQSHQIRHAFYNLSDGLGGSPVRMRGRAVRAGDGRLWFLTSRGATVIDPVTLGTRRAPAPVQLEEVVADGRRFDVKSLLPLSPRTNRIEINYTALELRAPQKTAFRYRLDGFDVDWIEAGTRRQASYTNLPPGNYRFQVAANNDDGTWNDPGASFEFSVGAAFYQTFWFRGAFALALALVVLVAWRLRGWQVRRRFGLLFGERVRLSNEIHDTLLQGLVGVRLQFDAISMAVGSSCPKATEQLGRAGRMVDRYIREARHAIWNLRSPLLETTDLATALQRTGEFTTADALVEFDFSVNGTPQPCSPKVEEQLLRIGQEALLNAVRHAHADHVRMQLSCEADWITLSVSDDGCGFQPGALNERSEHYGLISMKDRTEDIGGRFHLATTLGGGTRIETVVPRLARL